MSVRDLGTCGPPAHHERAGSTIMKKYVCLVDQSKFFTAVLSSELLLWGQITFISDASFTSSLFSYKLLLPSLAGCVRACGQSNLILLPLLFLFSLGSPALTPQGPLTESEPPKVKTIEERERKAELAVFAKANKEDLFHQPMLAPS